MTFPDLLRLIIANLKRMKGRVIMTALGVVIGTAAVMVLVSLGAGLQKQATESFGGGASLNDLRVHSITNGGGSWGPGMVAPAMMEKEGRGGTQRRSDEPVLNDEMLDAIRELDGVNLVTPIESLQASPELQYGKLVGYASVVGVEPVVLESLTAEYGSVKLTRGGIVLGAYIPEGFYDREMLMDRMGPVKNSGVAPAELEGARLTLNLQRYSAEDDSMSFKIIRLHVSGILESSGWRTDYTAYIPLRDAIEYNSWATGKRLDPGREGYQEVLVRAASSSDALQIESQIRDMGFIVQSERAQLEDANSFFAILQAILGGIGAIALLVAAFGISNTMLMAILERTREIGLMKAIGASNKDVMIVFLGESGGIGLLGGIGGVGLGLVLNVVLNLVGKSIQMGDTFGGMDPDMVTNITHTPVWLPLFAIIFATTIGVISGAYPASRAAMLSPIKALKYE